jgi:phage I-like protein
MGGELQQVGLAEAAERMAAVAGTHPWQARQHLEMVAAAPALDEVLASAAAPIDLVDGAAPERVKILPMGEIKLRDGRGPYQLRDQAHAQQVIANTRTYLGSLDFSFDYNHAVTVAGSDAKASGWCSPADLTAEADGIYANKVQWTPRGRQALEDREYRYISPLFVAAGVKDGGDVIHLKNASLVIIGAIDLPAVAAGVSGEEHAMDLAKFLALLGLPADAPEETVAAAIANLKGSTSIAAIAAAAGLAETATAEEVAAGVATLKSGATIDPTKFVPIEQLQQVAGQLSTLNDERAERVVAAAITAGKVAPAAKKWALDYFKKDEAGFNAYLGVAPEIVAAGAELGDRKVVLGDDTLTADEVAACALTGISHEDFIASRKELV